MQWSEDNFVNDYTLNIFCDASIKNYKDKTADGCYGAIAYRGKNEIDSLYKICSNTTNNNSEIKAIRNGVELALKWRYNFNTINIFSDSQISIFGIRDRIFNWVQGSNSILYGYDHVPIKSQDIFVEIMNIIISNNLYVNFYHQKGHVKTDSFTSLQNAEHVFKASNNIRENVDFNFIRYISILNNRVDDITGKILNKHNKDQKIYDGITFVPPENFENNKSTYMNLIGRGNYYE